MPSTPTPSSSPTSRPLPWHLLRPPSLGRLGVALVLAAAGGLFATTARTADGSDLRGDDSDLRGLVVAAQRQVASRDATLSRLRATVDAQASTVGDPTATRLRDSSDAFAAAAGLSAVRGPGVEVTLDDAPTGTAGTAGISPDVLVVHQQDLQGVVNALWAGGASALQLQDQRIIATSAVRCVGNTLKLQGRLYAPPYTVRAVGDPVALQQALDASPDVAAYRTDAERVGLRWDVTTRTTLTVKAFSGALVMQHARVLGGAGAAASGSVSGGGP